MPLENSVIKAIRHSGIVVRDLELSLDFYRDLLGLEIVARNEETGSFIDALVGIDEVRLEWVKLKAQDGSLLELLQYHSHPVEQLVQNAPSNQLGCSHLAYTVEDVQALFERFQQLKVSCVSPPQQSPDGKVAVMYCHDPDGVIIEFVQEL